MTETNEVLIEQLKLAVEMYRDANALNWSKFRHALYGLFLLGGAYLYTLRADFSPEMLRLIVPSFALVGMAVFAVALINGLTNLEKRARAVRTVEEQIIRDVRVKDAWFGRDLAEDPLWKTVKLTFYVGTGVVVVLWCIILIYHAVEFFRAGA